MSRIKILGVFTTSKMMVITRQFSCAAEIAQTIYLHKCFQGYFK